MFKVQYTVRIDEEVFDKIKTIAKIQIRPLGTQIDYFLKR